MSCVCSPSISFILRSIPDKLMTTLLTMSFPGGSDGKASACNAGDPGSIPGWGRSGERNGNPLHYSCLENPMEGGAWWATVYGVTKKTWYIH